MNYGNTRRVDEPRLSQGAGGLSGPALFARRSTTCARLRARFGDALEIIAYRRDRRARIARVARLDAGANACAYFTGFMTRGPLLARRILDALLAAHVK